MHRKVALDKFQFHNHRANIDVFECCGGDVYSLPCFSDDSTGGLSIERSVMRPVIHSELVVSHAGGQDRLPTWATDSDSGSNAVLTMSSLTSSHAFFTLLPLSATRQGRKIGDITMAVAASAELGGHRFVTG